MTSSFFVEVLLALSGLAAVFVLLNQVERENHASIALEEAEIIHFFECFGVLRHRNADRSGYHLGRHGLSVGEREVSISLALVHEDFHSEPNALSDDGAGRDDGA